MSIVPAILETEIHVFNQKVLQLERLPGVERIQVDFCDGDFVANKTLSVQEIDLLNPAFHWEAHLMVRAPKNFLDYQIAGFQTIILHYEAFAVEEQLDAAATEISQMGLKVAIAINPETPVSVLRYFGDTISQFTILSVQPGGQHRPFIEATFDRVADLRKLIPHATIEVDGGVQDSNAARLIVAGADLLAVGSALYETENLEENYSKIQQALIKK